MANHDKLLALAQNAADAFNAFQAEVVRCSDLSALWETTAPCELHPFLLEPIVNQAITLNPHDVEFPYMLAGVYQMVGAYEAAQAHVEHVLHLEPAHFGARRLRAEVEGDPQTSRQLWEDLIRDYPDRLELREAAGRMHRPQLRYPRPKPKNGLAER